MYTDFLASPLGWLKLTASKEALIALEFVAAPSETYYPNAITTEARKQLEEYFAAERQRFSLPLAPQGTPFQRKVWQALQTIPYGQTVSYKTIAAQINNPKAVRAVGLANGRNPIPIIIPCHRVVAADGSLGGFSSGLWRKEWLLKLEQIVAGCREE